MYVYVIIMRQPTMIIKICKDEMQFFLFKALCQSFHFLLWLQMSNFQARGLTVSPKRVSDTSTDTDISDS